MNRVFRKSLKIISYTLAALLLLTVTAAGILYYLYPPSGWHNRLVAEINKIPGVCSRLDHLSYSWDGRLVLNSFLLYEADNCGQDEPAQQAVFFKSDRIMLRFSLLSFIRGDYRLQSVALSDSEVKVHAAESKGTRWPRGWHRIARYFSAENDETSEAPGFRDYLPGSLQVEKLTLDWRLPAVYRYGGKYQINTEIDFGSTLQIKASVHETESGQKAVIDLAMNGFDRIKRPAQLADAFREKDRVDLQLQLNRINADYLKPLTGSLPVKRADGNLQLKPAEQGYYLKASGLQVWPQGRNFSAVINGSAYLGSNNRISSENLSVKLPGIISVKADELVYHRKLKKFRGTLSGKLGPVFNTFAPSLKGSGDISGTLNYRAGAAPEGIIKLSAATVYEGSLALIKKRDLTVTMKDGGLEIPLFTTDFLGQQLKLSVNGSYDKNWSINYRLSARHIDLEKVLNNLDKIRGGASGSAAGDVTVRGRLDFKKVSYGSYFLSDLNGQMSLDSAGLALNPVSFQFSGGSFRGFYRLKKTDHSFKLSFNGLQPTELLKMAGVKGRIFATASGSLTGSMNGNNSEQFKKTLDADLKVATGRGRLVNSFLQKGFTGGFLAPVEKKLNDIEFNRFSTALAAAGGRLYIRHGRFESDELKIKILAESNWQLQGEATAELRFTDSFIRAVANPIQLGISDTRVGDWYIMPFSCAGDFKNPGCWQAAW